MKYWNHLQTSLTLYSDDYDGAGPVGKTLASGFAGSAQLSDVGCLVDDARFQTVYNSSGAQVGCKDNGTGRIWALSAQKSTGSSYTHNGATGYCGGLTTGGTARGTWEIPTKDELVTAAHNGAGSHFDQPFISNYPNNIQCALTRWTRTKAPANKLYWVILGDPADAQDGVLNGVECPAQVGTATKGSAMDVICVLKAGASIP
jgi:hypothetical protein